MSCIYEFSINYFQFDGQKILWTQLLQLVEEDVGYRFEDAGRAGGFRFLNRITPEHLRLTPFSRMRVKLATQVIMFYLMSEVTLSTWSH